MYKIQVAAKTMFMLKKKMIEAAEQINAVDEEKETSAEELGYTGPTPAQRPVIVEPMLPPQAKVVDLNPPPMAEQNQSDFRVPGLSPAEAAFKAGLPTGNETIPSVSSVPPSTPSGMSSQTDARGFAWDPRIHATSKSTNKDGTWRYKRGVQQNEIDFVENQIRSSGQTFNPPPVPGSMSVPAPSAPIVQPAAVPSPFGAPPALPAAVTQSPFGALPPSYTPPVSTPAPVQSAPVQAVATPPPTLPGGTPAHSLETFKSNIIPLFAHLIEAGKITQDYVEQLKGHYKVKEVWDIAKNPQAAQEVFEGFASYGFITKV